MSRRTKTTRATSGQALYTAFDGDRMQDGHYSTSRIESELSRSQIRPQQLDRQFDKARYWFKYQWFVRGVTLLRYS